MKIHLGVFLVVLGTLVTFVALKKNHQAAESNFNQTVVVQENTLKQDLEVEKTSDIALGQNPGANFQPPLERAAERVTKKYFGIFITPKTSPVQPERFYGYHTGSDFETFPAETNSDVAVHAVCEGKLLLAKYASGYGGVMVQACTLNNQPITVVYGHVKLSSINVKAGENISIGQQIAVLGKGYSSETDGERKHLHLAFHKGTGINILGYVQDRSQLSSWIDPCQYVCGK